MGDKMADNLQEVMFQTAVREKRIISRLFVVVYIFIAGALVWGSVVSIRQTPEVSLAYTLGVWSGNMAVVMLALVLIPGILGRFSIQMKATRVITFYRRQLGITTFLLSLTHAMLVRIIPRVVLGWYPPSQAPLFELFGNITLPFLFLLFITSNDASVRRLGIWWKRIQRLAYIVVWLIFFHAILRRVSVWSILIGSVAVLEAVSLLWSSRLSRGRGKNTG